MKHYKNLFINQLNTKDVNHFTTDTGLFLRRKTNGAFRKLYINFIKKVKEEFVFGSFKDMIRGNDDWMCR